MKGVLENSLGIGVLMVVGLLSCLAPNFASLC
jgi:hypothetical protein